jgi:hypothetical protein
MALWKAAQHDMPRAPSNARNALARSRSHQDEANSLKPLDPLYARQQSTQLFEQDPDTGAQHAPRFVLHRRSHVLVESSTPGRSKPVHLPSNAFARDKETLVKHTLESITRGPFKFKYLCRHSDPGRHVAGPEGRTEHSPASGRGKATWEDSR